MRRGITVALALIATVSVSSDAVAMSVLCVEQHSSGFDWRNGAWAPTTFRPKQIVISDVSENRQLAGYCVPTPKTVHSYGLAESTRCFNFAPIGEEKSELYTSSCRILYLQDQKTIRSVECDDGFIQYSFEPDGSFVRSHTYAALIPPSAAGGKDSLVLAIGKCSVIEP